MENARMFRELIDALDEERRKVEIFQAELPLCLQLVNQTIESYKQLMIGAETVSHELAVKEFISLRPSSVSVEEDAIPHEEITGNNPGLMIRSTQLFTQRQDPLPQVFPLEKPIAVRATKDWGGIQYFDREEDIPQPAIASEALACPDIEISSDGNGDSHEDDKKDQKSQPRRKVRRYWPEELHKRFLHALDRLGGCDAATPKHIRKLMKVDGLTNDEVKSHLQKFRLHARRSSASTIPRGSNSNTQSFVVVRGIWIPTPDCVIVTSTDGAAAQVPGLSETGKYTPLVPPPSPLVFLDQNCQTLTNKESDM